MSISVESVASTRSETKENVRVDSLIPSLILERAETLKVLLQDYYSYLNEPKTIDNTGVVTELAKPSHEIASIMAARDIDSADYAYLDRIQAEIAATVPKKVGTDRVTLYKNLIRYYSVRGSEDSIELFFKIIFNDNVEVYYPYKDVLIPSSGTWDKTGRSALVVPEFDQALAGTFQVIVTDPEQIWNRDEIIYGGYLSGASGAYVRVLSQDGYIVTLTDISKDINGDTINLLKNENAIGETTIELTPFIDSETVSGIGTSLGTTGVIDSSTFNEIILSGVSVGSGSSGFIIGGQISTTDSGGSGNVRTITKVDNRIKLGLETFPITANVYDSVTGAFGIVTDATPTRISIDYDAGSITNTFRVGSYIIGNTGIVQKLLIGGIDPFWELETTTSSATSGVDFTIGEKVTITQDSVVIETGTVLHWDGTFLEVRTVSGNLSISEASGAGVTIVEGLTSGTSRVISVYEYFTEDVVNNYEFTIDSGSGLDVLSVGDIVSGENSGAVGTIESIIGSSVIVHKVTGGFLGSEKIWKGLYPSPAPHTIVSVDAKTAIVPIKPLVMGEKVYGSVSGATGYLVDVGDSLNPSLRNVDGEFTTSDLIVSYRYGTTLDITSVDPTIALSLNKFKVGETITGTSVTGKITNVNDWTIRVQYCNIDPSNYSVGETLTGASSLCSSVIDSITLGYSKTLLGFYIDGQKSFTLNYSNSSGTFAIGDVIRDTVTGSFAKIVSISGDRFSCINPTGYFAPGDPLIVYNGGSGSGTANVVSAFNDGIYLDNKGFLDNTIKVQDSYFYQKFSYVIRTGTNVSEWKSIFERLVHPAGFIFFGEILILIEGINSFSVDPEDFEGQDAQRINSSMKTLQPGLISDEDLPLQIIISPIGGPELVDIFYSDASGGTFEVGETVVDSVTEAAGIVTFVSGTTSGYVRVESPNGEFLVGSTITQIYGSGPTTVTATVESSYRINTAKRIFNSSIQRALEKTENGIDVQDTVPVNSETELDVKLMFSIMETVYGGDQAKYYDDQPINLYKNLTIEEAATGDYIWDDLVLNDLSSDVTTTTGSGTSGIDFTIGESVEITTGVDLIETGKVLDWDGTNLHIITESGFVRYVSGVTLIEGLSSGTTRLISNAINNSATWNGAKLSVALI